MLGGATGAGKVIVQGAQGRRIMGRTGQLIEIAQEIFIGISQASELRRELVRHRSPAQLISGFVCQLGEIVRVS